MIRGGVTDTARFIGPGIVGASVVLAAAAALSAITRWHQRHDLRWLGLVLAAATIVGAPLAWLAARPHARPAALVALDPSTGEVRWTATLPFEVVSAVAVHDRVDGAGAVVVTGAKEAARPCSSTAQQVAVGLTTGKLLTDAPADTTSPAFPFDAESVTAAGLRIGVSRETNDLRLVAVTESSGATVWEHEVTNAPRSLEVAADAGVLIAHAHPGSANPTEIIELATGRLRWSHAEPLLAVDQTAYVVGDDGVLAARRLADGRGMWRASARFGPAASATLIPVTQGVIVVQLLGNKVAIVETGGRLLWRESVPPRVRDGLVVTADAHAVYLAGGGRFAYPCSG
jgi:outer membrane protein assembly factor BamB